MLFDGTSPTTVDQDFTKELKTKDWKTEADVMAALGAVGHAAEHLAIYDDVDLVRQKLEAFAPDILFNLVEQFLAARLVLRFASTKAFRKKSCTIMVFMFLTSSSSRAANALHDPNTSSFQSW